MHWLCNSHKDIFHVKMIASQSYFDDKIMLLEFNIPCLTLTSIFLDLALSLWNMKSHLSHHKSDGSWRWVSLNHCSRVNFEEHKMSCFKIHIIKWLRCWCGCERLVPMVRRYMEQQWRNFITFRLQYPFSSYWVASHKYSS